MEFNLTDVHVKNEEEFRQLIEQINTDIEFANYFQKDKPAEQLLDVKYLVSRYQAIMGKEERKVFREEHDCEYCLYYENKSCRARKKCPLDELEKKERRRIQPKAACPKDKEGNCPYGNEVGTCFGFCWRDIFQKHKERKQKYAQKETKANG